MGERSAFSSHPPQLRHFDRKHSEVEKPVVEYDFFRNTHRNNDLSNFE